MALILVVDDDPQVRSMLSETLQMLGHSVMEAEDGVACMSRLNDAVPDLIFLDLIMPNKEGMETICEIREHLPTVPVITISSGGNVTADLDYLSISKELGANHTLSKPLGVKQIVQVVNELLTNPVR